VAPAGLPRQPAHKIEEEIPGRLEAEASWRGEFCPHAYRRSDAGPPPHPIGASRRDNLPILAAAGK
jgi:hypothetical protein